MSFPNGSTVKRRWLSDYIEAIRAVFRLLSHYFRFTHDSAGNAAQPKEFAFDNNLIQDMRA